MSYEVGDYRKKASHNAFQRGIHRCDSRQVREGVRNTSRVQVAEAEGQYAGDDAQNLDQSFSTQHGGGDHCGSRESAERFSVALGRLSIVEPRHQSGTLTEMSAGGLPSRRCMETYERKTNCMRSGWFLAYQVVCGGTLKEARQRLKRAYLGEQRDCRILSESLKGGYGSDWKVT